VLPPSGGLAHQRYSPCAQEHDDEEKLDRLECASVQSEPIRAPPVELPKRDSFSDSGAEGSGHNTPTRGRTFTEGLLRYVHDSSLQKPVAERRVSSIEQSSQSGPVAADNIQQTIPVAAHVPVIQANFSQQFSALNSAPFSGVIQQTHIPDAAYPRELNPHGSLSNLSGYGGGFVSQPSSVYPSSAMGPRYNSYMTAAASSLPASAQYQNNIRPSRVSPPPLRQEFRPQSQSQILGGETHSLRQPIMSSTAQPSLAYSSMTGLIPLMMMPSSSQGVYLAPRYQTPLGTIPGTPASPTGIDHRASNSGMIPAGIQHSGLVNFAGLANLHNSYRPLPGYPNMPINLGQGAVVIPEPGQSMVHDPANMAASLAGSHHPAAAAALSSNTALLNPGLLNPATSILNPSAGVINHSQAVINPASLAGISLNHPLGMAGASYPTPGDVLGQQVPLNVPLNHTGNPVSMNPTPVPSLTGSLAGSFHESAHGLEEQVQGTDLDHSKQS